ncbi:MAG TPA: winged helix-turn-helix transcriptional regulator [Acholeplasmataceae bacterium]|nr:winged helix-turn-helix transcriptional regulator [Acholeplasmataceae bacterium]
MKGNHFFKPTPLYKEFVILDLVERDPNITQRELSKKIGASVSMINSYLEEYEQKGYIKRDYISLKIVKYLITKKGIERKKLLNISYLNASQKIYQSAKENIISFLMQLINRGFKRILLYGAGEVAEILLNAINSDRNLTIKALGVIDDDPNKINHYLANVKIMSRDSIFNIDHDGILISSYTNNEKIYRNLLELNYNKDKIIQFFDL